ncbi:MAG: nitronate monooxygenase [Thermomicrobiales bacterium]|nr:nitronate monooxygenase [Thermomicrobiales bacterium]
MDFQTRAALRTPLCDFLGIEQPILKAPMAGGTDTVELVAAVSEAGGLGILGALMLSPEALRAAIRAIRARTDRPFGVNLIVHPPEPDGGDVGAARRFFARYREELGLPAADGEVALPPPFVAGQLQVICEEAVPVLNTMGDPTGLVDPAHAAGIKVMPFVTTVAEARRAVALGADAVVAQGAEAGGLRGTFRLGPDGEVPLVGTMALVPQVVDAVKVPVVAAGGIMDGRGLLAALALGAAGVMLGTRFSLARESGVTASWRAALQTADETDVVVDSIAIGRPARSLRNRLVEEYQRAGLAPLPFPRQYLIAAEVHVAAQEQDRAELTYLAAGQGVRLAKDGQPAAEIVAELVSGAESALRCLARGALVTATSGTDH